MKIKLQYLGHIALQTLIATVAMDCTRNGTIPVAVLAKYIYIFENVVVPL